MIHFIFGDNAMKCKLKSSKFTQNNSTQKAVQSLDSGRSMVEMLGVLAIVGVLSIGGIMGYKYAMNKYLVNKIANELNLLSNQATISLNVSHEKDFELQFGTPYDDQFKLVSANYHFFYGCGDYLDDNDICHKNGSSYYMVMSGVPADICRLFVPMGKYITNVTALEVNEVENGTAADCIENAHDQEIVLLFNANSLTDSNDDDDDPDTDTDDENNDEEKVECDADVHCPEMCDLLTHTCRTCYSFNHHKPMWEYNSAEGMYTCQPCPENSYWNIKTHKCQSEVKEIECVVNAQCPAGQYCWALSASTSMKEGEVITSSRCRPLSEKSKESGQNPQWFVSEDNMTWWSAVRFCQALGHPVMLSIQVDLNCDNPTLGKKWDDIRNNYDGNGICKENDKLPKVLDELYSAYGKFWGWTGDYFADDFHYNFSSKTGEVQFQYNKNYENYYHAVCSLY